MKIFIQIDDDEQSKQVHSFIGGMNAVLSNDYRDMVSILDKTEKLGFLTVTCDETCKAILAENFTVVQ